MQAQRTRQFTVESGPYQHNRLAQRHEDVKIETEHFVQTVVKPHAEAIRRMGAIPDEVIRALGTAGWFGLLIPRKFGGRGLDCLARILNVEYMTRGCPDVGAVLQIGQLGTGTLIEFGSPAQQAKWLPLMATGERLCTISITEEQSGSHILGMQTTYEDRGDTFVLSGEKWFIGNCPISNLHVVFALDQNQKKLSAFIVEGERPGVDNTMRHKTIGLRAFPFGRLKLDEVEIPRANLIGTIGQGQDIAHRIISHHGRPSLTGLALGIHHRIYDLAYSYSGYRELYGKNLRALPEIRQKIFEIYERFELCRQAAYEAADLDSAGEKSYRALSMAKYLNSERAFESAMIATDIFGARAGLPEYEIGQLMLDAMMTRPPSGTGDVQKRRIMEHLFEEKTPAWEMDEDENRLAQVG